MYAKSIIKHVRERLAAGGWTQQLSFVPVVMALVVVALPFTLAQRAGSISAAGAPGDADMAVVESADSSLVKTAANPRAALQEDRRHAIVAEYMARRFFVSKQVMLDWVKTAHVVGRQYNVDPTLLVAVMTVESSFNPIAESVAGAKGLMQIIPHYHLEKFTEFGGEQAVFDPRTNIAVGAKIIREYLQMYQGNLFTALQMYAGALPDHDASYTHKVLNEKDRLDVIMGLPKTDRGGRVANSAPAAAPAAATTTESKERVQVIIPPASSPIPPALQLTVPPAPPTPPAPAPALPSASVPSPVAALRLP